MGSATPLAVQESRRSMVSAYHALTGSLDRLGLPYRTGPFESVIVNDEYVWENYGIPMVSFSRFPYPEYHSSRDSRGDHQGKLTQRSRRRSHGSSGLGWKTRR